MPDEPLVTAWVLLVAALLFLASVLFSRASARIGLPIFLPFLVVGMLAGSEGLGRVSFEDYQLAFRLGTVALVLILFDGGLNTPTATLRQVIRPAAMLATLGVIGVAALAALCARLFGLNWPVALLLGAVVSSTDAAAVFSVLRASGIQIKRRPGLTLELESGLNDSMAVLLTTVVTQSLVSGEMPGWRLPLALLAQLGVGLACGLALGHGGRALLRRVKLPAGGLYAVLTVSLALLAFAIPTLLFGSGFLAVYVGALVLGSGELPYRSGLLRFHDATAWLSQVTMFLLLGLLVFPSRLVPVAWVGLGIGLLLAVVVRPVIVWLCLLPFRYPKREVAYIGWVGLRGAVPIILATYPVLAGVTGSELLFNLVFFVVVVSAILPGGTVPWLTRRLRLESDAPPPPQAVLEISSTLPLEGEITSHYIHPALAAAGVAIRDLPFPGGASVMLILRGRELIPPKGSTVLLPGDHVYVFSRASDRPLIQLLFGQQEEG